MWVVGINRPYYPSHEYFETQEQAEKEYKTLLEEHSEGGRYDVSVFMATVIQEQKIKTDY